MNGGEVLVSALEEAGVTHVFGLLGSSTMEVYDALYEHPTIRYIGVRDERSGTHMADGFGRISGRPAVILAGQAGAGSANLLTGLLQAQLAYSPVIAVTGLVSTGHFGRDTLQEFDQQSVFLTAAKKSWTVLRADRIGEFVREAVRYSTIGRRGPVLLQIPRDLFAQNVDEQPQTWDTRGRIGLGVPDSEQVANIVALIKQAKAPVIIAGGGIKSGRGSKLLQEFSERLQIPIAASAGHGDVVNNDHPLFAGQVGGRGNEVASRLAREADLILAIGTRLGFNTTFYNYENLSQTAKIVQVDVEPIAVGRFFPIEIGVVADATKTIQVLLDAMKGFDSAGAGWRGRNEEFLKQREALHKTRAEAGESTAVPMRPERVFAELRSALARDTIVSLDAGTLCLQATDQLSYFDPPSLMTPLDFGLVGMSFAAGLGAKLAAPKRPVLSVMGDGGFGMAISEFTTAIQHQIPTVTVVLDNGIWGAEKAYQRDFYNGRYVGADVLSPPFDEFARICGCPGYRVNGPGEIGDAVRDAFKSGKPAIVQVKVDPEAIVSFRRDAFKHRSTR